MQRFLLSLQRTLLLPILLSISKRKPSITNFRVKALEKARAVFRMLRLRTVYEALIKETEFVGEGKLLLNTPWKRHFRRFMNTYVLPWDENLFCEHLGRAKEG